jgi:hypothetical protein
VHSRRALLDFLAHSSGRAREAERTPASATTRSSMLSFISGTGARGVGPEGECQSSSLSTIRIVIPSLLV